MGRTKPESTRRRVGIHYVQPTVPMSPTASTVATATGMTTPTKSARASTPGAFSPAASPIQATPAATGSSSRSSAAPELSQLSSAFQLGLRSHATSGLDAIEPPQIESECTVDASMSPANEPEEEPRALQGAQLTRLQQQQQLQQQDSPLPHTPQHEQHAPPQVTAPPPPPQERMVTVSAAELERWQQRVVSHIEAHFSCEQLKRIAEFGSAHANLLVEAKEYVYNIETQLSAQFDKERADIRAQAEAYVAQAHAESEQLRRTIAELQQEVALLRLPRRRNRIAIAITAAEDGDEYGDKGESGGTDDNVEVNADAAIESSEDAEEVSSSSSCSSSSSSQTSSSIGSPDVELVEVKRKLPLDDADSDDADSDDHGRRRKKGAKLLLRRGDERNRNGKVLAARASAASSRAIDRVGGAG